LLLLNDSLDIFNKDIDDEELDYIKGQLCFKPDIETFLIKPGGISGFNSLRDALKSKLDEQVKQSKK
jgi:hypothetical protein